MVSCHRWTRLGLAGVHREVFLPWAGLCLRGHRAPRRVPAFGNDNGRALNTQTATKDKEIRIQRFVAKETKEFLEVFRPKVKDVKNFWLIALVSVGRVSAGWSCVVDGCPESDRKAC